MHKSYTLNEIQPGIRCYSGVLNSDQCTRAASKELINTSPTSPWFKRRFFCCAKHATDLIDSGLSNWIQVADWDDA